MIKKISVITVFLLIFCFISCANAIDYFDEEFEITLRKKLN